MQHACHFPLIRRGAHVSRAAPQGRQARLTENHDAFAHPHEPGWYGVWTPKDLPAKRQQTLHQAINEATRQLVKSGAYTPLGIDPVIESIDDFRKYSQRYGSDGAALLKSSGYKPE